MGFKLSRRHQYERLQFTPSHDTAIARTLFIDADAKEATLIKTDQATGAVTTHGVVLSAKDTKAQRRLASFNSASSDKRCHANGACLFTYAELMQIHGRDKHGRVLAPKEPPTKPGEGQTTTTAGKCLTCTHRCRCAVARKYINRK